MIDGFKSWNTKTYLDDDFLNLNGLRISKNKHDGHVVEGSLHKFSNAGVHNANDFMLSNLKDTLNLLFDNIGLNPDITVLNGFEFGVNITLPFSPNEALKCIILHKSNSGVSDKIGKKFEYQKYSVKLYNKSTQCKVEPYQSENILRVEVKVRKMSQFKKCGIYCKVLSDLLDEVIWERLEDILIETLNECLVINLTESEIELLSDKDKIMYLKYINPLYWDNLHLNRKTFSRERERCNKFLDKHSKSTLKADLIYLISKKCKELRDVTAANLIEKKWDELPVLSFANQLQRCDELPVLCDEKRNESCDEIPIKMNEYFVLNQFSEDDRVKMCKGCGRIIKNPKKNQSFCSAQEVGYVEAHRCRNKNSNPRNKAKASIRRLSSIPLLFDLSEIIAPEKIKYLDCV